MKKLINKPSDVVKESLVGMSAAHSDILTVHYAPDFITRKTHAEKGKVCILSGGGSGHEPLHGGFVGYGMLDAACPGAVFTSPTPDQMYAAAKEINTGSGVLFIIKNYTGDILNFEMAADLCRSDGIDVEYVVIDDDVAVKDSLYTAGRRGVGLTVLAEKLLGAAAEQKRSLKELVALAKKINGQGRTMGMALTSCTVPAAGKPTFDLPADEMEIGIGIHGEPGRQREKLRSAASITQTLAQNVIDDLPFKAGDSVCAFVNGLGGTPLIELYIVYNELEKICKQHGIKITRKLVGSYITSLDMAGCSITLLKMDKELESLWDAPVHTAALRWGI